MGSANAASVVIAVALFRGAWRGLKWALTCRDPRRPRATVFVAGCDTAFYRRAATHFRFTCEGGHDFAVSDIAPGMRCPACGAGIARWVGPHTIKAAGRIEFPPGWERNLYRAADGAFEGWGERRA